MFLYYSLSVHFASTSSSVCCARQVPWVLRVCTTTTSRGLRTIGSKRYVIHYRLRWSEDCSSFIRSVIACIVVVCWKTWIFGLFHACSLLCSYMHHVSFILCLHITSTKHYSATEAKLITQDGPPSFYMAQPYGSRNSSTAQIGNAQFRASSITDHRCLVRSLHVQEISCFWGYRSLLRISGLQNLSVGSSSGPLL